MAAWKPADLANTAWAVAKLKCSDHPLLESLSSAAITMIGDLSAEDLSSFAWAWASLA